MMLEVYHHRLSRSGVYFSLLTLLTVPLALGELFFERVDDQRLPEKGQKFWRERVLSFTRSWLHEERGDGRSPRTALPPTHETR